VDFKAHNNLPIARGPSHKLVGTGGADIKIISECGHEAFITGQSGLAKNAKHKKLARLMGHAVTPSVRIRPLIDVETQLSRWK
jgi:hypothetical protein